MTDCGKGGFDRISGADALAMWGGDVEECGQLFAILLQAQRRIGVLWIVSFGEQIGGLDCILFNRRLCL